MKKDEVLRIEGVLKTISTKINFKRYGNLPCIEREYPVSTNFCFEFTYPHEGKGKMDSVKKLKENGAVLIVKAKKGIK